MLVLVVPVLVVPVLVVPVLVVPVLVVPVLVVPVLVVPVGVLDVVGVLEVGVLGGGVLVFVGVVAAGAQLMPRAVAPSGSEIADSGVPAGTSSVSVCVAPPSNLMVTEHVSAEEDDGSAATPIATSAVIAATTSFRLRGTVAESPPAGLLEQVVRAATTGGVAGTLLRERVVCNGEPSPTDELALG